MSSRKALNYKRERRRARSRSRIRGTASVPRLAVFRSNQSIYAQLIDDERAHTLVAASLKEVPSKERRLKTESARLVGALIAEKALRAGITRAVFDRRHYRFHGRVRALAEGATAGGLKV